jgi:hypothetical protein
MSREQRTESKISGLTNHYLAVIFDVYYESLSTDNTLSGATDLYLLLGSGMHLDGSPFNVLGKRIGRCTEALLESQTRLIHQENQRTHYDFFVLIILIIVQSFYSSR